MSHHTHRWALRALAVAAAAALTQPARAVDFSFSTGAFVSGATAPNPLAAADTLLITSGGAKSFVNQTWTNQGTVRWQADILSGGNSTITNAGLWDSQHDNNSFSWTVGGRPQFINTGEFLKSAGNNTALGNWAIVSNGGTWRASVGAIEFNGGVADFNAGTRFTGAGSVLLSSAANFSGNQFSDNLVISAGTATGNAAVLAGGVGTAGKIAWTGGTIAGTWSNVAGAVLEARDLGNKSLVSGSFANAGTVRWTGGTLTGGSSSYANSGLFEAQSDPSMTWTVGNRLAFANSGTFRAAVGVTLTNASVDFTNNAGTVDVQAGGTVLFNSGVATFNNGSQFTGTGVVAVNSAATFVGQFSSQNLELRAGTLTGGDGSLGSKAVAQGTTRWTGSTLSGNWEVGAGHSLLGVGASDKPLVNGNLVNNGNLLWQGSGNVSGGNGALTNNATFEVQANSGLLWTVGNRLNVINAATGTLRAAQNVSFTNANANFVNDGGVLEALAGGQIVYSGGVNRFNQGTRFNGAGQNFVVSDAMFVGAYTSQNLVLQSGTFTGGDGSVGSSALAQGNTQWTGGTLAGTWVVGAGHALAGAGSANKSLVNGDLVNNGIVLWQGDGAFAGGNGTFTNKATFEAQANSSLFWTVGNRLNITNGAAGTLRAAQNVTLTNANTNLVNDGGVLEALAGGQIIYNGGSNRFNAGTRFNGAGQNIVNSGATFVGAFTSQNLVLQSGTLTGGDGSPGSSAVAQGTTQWTGATFSGTWEVANGHTLVGQGSGARALVNGSLTNNGTLQWQAGGSMAGGNGTYTNNGRHDLQGDVGVVWTVGNQLAMVNNGLLVKTAGAGDSNFSNLNLQNNGTIQVDVGRIVLPAGFSNTGTITGAGAVATNVLTNLGHVAPGSGTGTLRLDGSFVQTATGTFDVDLTDLSAHDLLQVNGNATLSGNLALFCLGACHYAVGDSILILDATGSLSGTFTAVHLQGFQSGAFNVVYDTAASEVRLLITQDVVASVPEPRAWALMLAGLLAVGGLARRRSGAASH